jgi:hypothetical protein
MAQATAPILDSTKADTAERFMSTHLKAKTIAFLVAATTSLVDHTDSALAQALPCRSQESAHNAYTVCEVDLAKHTVRLYRKRSEELPMRISLRRAATHTIERQPPDTRRHRPEPPERDIASREVCPGCSR